MEDTEKVTKEYEIGVLVRKEDDLAHVRQFVEQHQGTIVADFQAKKIALAYPIEREEEAFFAFARFSTGPADVKQLEHDLRTENTVLRSLITIPFKMSRREAVGLSKKRNQAPARSASSASQPSTSFVPTLSNEALEKKIEEMLK